MKDLSFNPAELWILEKVVLTSGQDKGFGPKDYIEISRLVDKLSLRDVETEEMEGETILEKLDRLSKEEEVSFEIEDSDFKTLIEKWENMRFNTGVIYEHVVKLEQKLKRAKNRTEEAS